MQLPAFLNSMGVATGTVMMRTCPSNNIGWLLCMQDNFFARLVSSAGKKTLALRV